MTTSTTLFIGLFATIHCLASLSASFSLTTTQLLSSSLRKTTHTQLNLVPLSEVWDSSSCNENQISFADLVRQLDCKSFDSDGRLITSSTKNDDTNNYYRLYLATHVDDLPPIV